MSLYLDASALVAMFASDPFTSRIDQFLERNKLTLFVSDFAAAEWSSTVARHSRSRHITQAMARELFAKFDAWSAQATQRVETTSDDITRAETMLRRLDLNLRAPDAIHVAIAQRLGATLVTFDQTMGASARRLGVIVAKA